MSEKTNLEPRIAIVETKVEDIKESILEIKEITFLVRDTINKQNGILPRLEKSFSSIADQIGSFDKKLDLTSEKLVGVTLKIKILWSIVATLGGSVLVAALAYLFSKI